MKAVVVAADKVPVYGDVPEPQAGGLDIVSVRAAALTNLDITIAEGRHYFSPRAYPAIVGREAVVSVADGRRFYLNVRAIPEPWGSMVERTVADLNLALPVPDGIADDVAAALGNAGLAGWLPLSWRTRLAPGETVLILGATGTSGLIAVSAAAALGAGRIVAVGRNAASLQRARALGAHHTIALGEGVDVATEFQKLDIGGADIVVDYLNGPPAESSLEIMATGGRMVQIGSTLAPGIHLPAQLARKASLDVLGFAYYHAPVIEQRAAYQALCMLQMQGKVFIETQTLPLSEFATAWASQKSGAGPRMVLTP